MTARTRGMALGLVLCGALTACVYSPVDPGEPLLEKEYHVAAPDVLRISVAPAGLNRNVTVRPDGKISFDLIGDVMVEGQTIEQIRQEITDRIQEFVLNPEVSVELAVSNSRKYYVFGEVRSPGAYPLIGVVRVGGALAQAGGPTLYASENGARLVRATEGGGVFSVRLADITKKADGSTNYQLEPEDVLYVPPNAWARVGFAIQIVFFPIQQVIGLGGRVVRGF